jgi:replicative DNA helicase
MVKPNSYIDLAAVTQVIGCIFNNSSILDDTDKYVVHEEDFTEDFHKITFGAIYNIHLTGSKVNMESVIDYLANRPKYDAIFKKNKGVEYLAEAAQVSKPETFNYYYGRMKKFSLLRAYASYGLDVSYLYDPENILDTKKKQQQEDWLDNTSILSIAQHIDNKIDEIKTKYVDDDLGDGYQAGEGINDLIENLKRHPEIGIPMYGPLINTATRGARLGKLYLRSGATGMGKSRAMIADVCNFACNEIFYEQFGWTKNGTSQPTLYIATEQDLSEVQTMMLAFLSNVNEEHILNGQYLEGEEERVLKAADIISRSPLWVETLPDFSLQDVENLIKKNIREHDVKYVAFDYVQTSLKILEEITKRSGGVRLREDNILFMLSARLKDIANQYGIFILTATQLNADYKESETPDQNLLRGAKSIADRVDVGMILLEVTAQDLEKLAPILAANPTLKVPNVKLSIYKNRRGSYKGVYLFCYADLGVCRIDPQFCTNWRFDMVSIEDVKVIVDEGEAPWN